MRECCAAKPPIYEMSALHLLRVSFLILTLTDMRRKSSLQLPAVPPAAAPIRGHVAYAMFQHHGTVLSATGPT